MADAVEIPDDLEMLEVTGSVSPTQVAYSPEVLGSDG